MQYSDLYNDSLWKARFMEEYEKEIDKLSQMGYRGFTLTQCARAMASDTMKTLKYKKRNR